MFFLNIYKYQSLIKTANCDTPFKRAFLKHLRGVRLLKTVRFGFFYLIKMKDCKCMGLNQKLEFRKKVRNFFKKLFLHYMHTYSAKNTYFSKIDIRV